MRFKCSYYDKLALNKLSAYLLQELRSKWLLKPWEPFSWFFKPKLGMPLSDSKRTASGSVLNMFLIDSSEASAAH